LSEKKNSPEEKRKPETSLAGKGNGGDGEEKAGRGTDPIIEEPGGEKAEQDPAEKIRGQLEEKTREAAENFDKWVRLRAEFENFKKRAQKERADTIRFGNEGLLQAMLPALDNLARAIAQGRKAKEIDSLLEGVEMTHQQFLNILEKYGVRPIQAVGDLFNPEKHEALAQEENEEEPQRVIAEVEKGYLFHDRLLRPAKVIVSKGKARKKTEGSE
jgi:molecular chaperone GrpE